jgi:hypothetical protein
MSADSSRAQTAAERPGKFRGRHSIVVVSLTVLVAVGNLRARADDRLEFFEARIRPVLVRHCYECHSVASSDLKGELKLDSRDAALKGGESGPSIVPGKPDESLLLSALRHDELKMPPDRRLPDAVIADFKQWIRDGAFDPRDSPPDPKVAAESVWEATYRERLSWWSLQPLANVAIPEPTRRDWSNAPIDRFILKRLEEHNLQPAAPADRRILMRRLSFALTGLPPHRDLVERFLSSDRSGAFLQIVDQLLESPHFGEHWARHWMDVVRYTDTYGYEWDIPAKGAWRYRDYLVRAFNADVPFDQLIREQIAGDLLEEPRLNRKLQINESLIGPMFFQMGEKRHGDSADFNGIHQEMLDNKIDAFSKAFQAITVSCARCHDHKLDPISQREYYALGGVFFSSRWLTNTLDLPERNAARLDKLRNKKLELRTLLAKTWIDELSATETGLLGNPADGSALSRLFEAATKTAPAIESPLHPWLQLTADSNSVRSVAANWQSLIERYAGESRRRREQNQKRLTVLADFRDGIPDGWSVDGVGLRNIARSGDFAISTIGETVIEPLQLGGLMTNSLSSQLNGAVRSPLLSGIEEPLISFEVSGGDFAAHRTVVDNAFLTERQGYLKAKSANWQQFSTRPAGNDRAVYVEFATKSSNPNFPPRVGLGGACREEQAADPRSWFCVSRVVALKSGGAPLDELSRFESLFAGEAPKTRVEAALRYIDWFRRAINNWSHDAATDSDVRIINWLLETGLVTNARHPGAIRDAVAEYREIELQIEPPQTVNGMADLDAGADYRLNHRGDYNELRDPIPRGYLRLISESTGDAAEHVTSASRRRELAELVASPKNPLTARVYVNRVWHWLFGTGLVATPGNFGQLGERPSHPELLDWLTTQFIQDGWSTRKLIRRIVCSETWRQSGTQTEAASAVDPRNRLLHHFPLRRLSAEEIRDSILAVSGRLDRSLFGPTVNPYRTSEDDQKRLLTGPLDGNGRRSIYTKITIMEAPKFLDLFNQPKPKIPTSRRDVSNTPTQSLALLNDPFVKQQSEFSGQRIVRSPPESLEAGLNELFEAAFARPMTPAERSRWAEAATGFRQFGAASNATDLLSDPNVWAALAHSVFNTKEFIYTK